ncbi:MAG: hypothetical protein WCG42_06865 [Parachlamydiaceae bacterium]
MSAISTIDMTININSNSFSAHSAFLAGRRVVHEAKNKLESVVEGVFHALGDLSDTTTEMASVCRKIYQYHLNLTESLIKAPQKFSKLSTILSAFVDVIDGVQLIGDIEYFVQAKFREDSFVKVAARVATFAADVGGTLIWLQSMAFINLSKAATSIGNARTFSFVPKLLSSIPGLCNIPSLQSAAQKLGKERVFSFVAKVSPTFAVLRILDIMYSFLAIDAGQRLAQAKNQAQKINATIDLSSCATELGLSVAVLAGATNAVALGVLGVVSIGLTISSLLYRAAHEKDICQEKPPTTWII